jgi:hypothetical protein
MAELSGLANTRPRLLSRAADKCGPAPPNKDRLYGAYRERRRDVERRRKAHDVEPPGHNRHVMRAFCARSSDHCQEALPPSLMLLGRGRQKLKEQPLHPSRGCLELEEPYPLDSGTETGSGISTWPSEGSLGAFDAAITSFQLQRLREMRDQSLASESEFNIELRSRHFSRSPSPAQSPQRRYSHRTRSPSPLRNSPPKFTIDKIQQRYDAAESWTQTGLVADAAVQSDPTPEDKAVQVKGRRVSVGQQTDWVEPAVRGSTSLQNNRVLFPSVPYQRVHVRVGGSSIEDADVGQDATVWAALNGTPKNVSTLLQLEPQEPGGPMLKPSYRNFIHVSDFGGAILPRGDNDVAATSAADIYCDIQLLSAADPPDDDELDTIWQGVANLGARLSVIEGTAKRLDEEVEVNFGGAEVLHQSATDVSASARALAMKYIQQAKPRGLKVVDCAGAPAAATLKVQEDLRQARILMSLIEKEQKTKNVRDVGGRRMRK